ncbi:MAG: hypothetical protein IPJ03_17305 [Ignavibacteriales bacterium]|nr:hypothetical protein [Ignavibacteriales bacterium]MBK7380717.1 hypothetical protein [Ignavibacteriales bacterium]
MVEITEALLKEIKYDYEDLSGFIVASDTGSTGIIIQEGDKYFIKSLDGTAINDPEIEGILKQKYNLETVEISGSKPFEFGKNLKFIGSALLEGDQCE